MGKEVDPLCPVLWCHAALDTLCHLLNRCKSGFGLMRERLNCFNCLNSAFWLRSSRNISAFWLRSSRNNQSIPGTSDLLRPDLVIIDEDRSEVRIVDVTVPFEADGGALQRAHVGRRINTLS